MSTQTAAAKREPAPVDRSRAIKKGYWVAVTLTEPVAPMDCYVGQVRELDADGFRLTLIDWLTGHACGWDLYVPWRHVGTVLIATPEHSLERFGEAAGKWQSGVGDRRSGRGKEET